jgi:hypothetical protein
LDLDPYAVGWYKTISVSGDISGFGVFSFMEVPAMNRAVCKTKIFLLLTMALNIFAVQPGERDHGAKLSRCGVHS